MWHIKHYCKLIFSTLAVVLVFACSSFTAHADPLTGAMLAAAAADGFAITGMAGLPADSISAITDISFYDFVPWDDLVLAGKAYLTIRDLIGSNNVEIELSPELSYDGYIRIGQINSKYDLAPGTVHSFGTKYAYNGYVFVQQVGTYRYIGPSLGYLDYSAQRFSVANDCYLDVDYLNSRFSFTSVIGSFTNTFSSAGNPSWLTYPLVLSIDTSNLYLYWGLNNSGTLIALTGSSSTGMTIDSINSSIYRSNDSVIIDASNKANKVVLPALYLQDVTYTSGEVIDTEQVVSKVLDVITKASSEDDILESTYENVSPTPVPGDTVAETSWDDFTDFFHEAFGDIYDGISTFQESFGDWVDSVASGWTEVFGDIFSDLHDFKEAFGDWVDDVSSGWTEVFGDIYSTVSSIYSTVSGTITNTLSAIATAVSTLVQTIENADFQFIEGFWKNFITPFNTLFNTIKSHLSIWHYVVEWLSSISGVFTFYLGVMNGAGSGFLLPIYACFAGTVVLAVYKRFGK